ncbi:hypothetical protein [Methylomonas rapida]|uniref:Uncharacterized protein n=1 Tax=Methylomonas rapida TaxID=2963939 RepID=A0ABY7GEY6_9GAMM|nr:hypothetical protein [Methylomonas rapida]WAR42991.1 hypothetical protein NM686_011305 [Methylomonas rapida]
MPSLFEGYCYSTTQEAADADLSRGLIAVDTGLLGGVAVTNISGTTADLTFNYQPFAGGLPVIVSITRAYPSCSSVGYHHNYSGLTLSDVVEVSWMVVLVWASAWAIKSMRARG